MHNFLHKIYHYLPLTFQNIAISIFGYSWNKRRYGGIFYSEFQNALQREFNSKEQWYNYQKKLLIKLLIHSFDNVTYYRKMFDNLKITKEQINNFEINDLSRLPILEKQTLRELGCSELLSSILESNGLFLSSSGSTGTPTKVLYSKRMHQSYFAIYESRIHLWAGINKSTPRGVIGGRRIIKSGFDKGPFYRYNYVEKQTYFSAYHLSPKTVSNYVEGMKKNRVEYMTGYASSNYFLARFIEEAGIIPPKLKAVLTSSEKLTPEMRDTFRRVYGCESFDSYNGVDLCNLISECEFHNLHVVPDVGIVEIINSAGKPCQPGETGEIISTGLLNFDQPLIRYRIGDYVKVSLNQDCKCGRNMLIIDEIVGRIEDTVIGVDGREIVRFHGIFIDIFSIIEAQVIQHELTVFEIRIVESKKLSHEEKKLIEQRMFSQLGSIQLTITTVNEIPRNSNGKFISVISHINRIKKN